MKISVLTLGCKANQAESFTIESNLLSKGHELVSLNDAPDVCIINTCTVTSKSDYQSRQLIRRANRAGAKVLVTGCYSELNKDRVSSMEGVGTVYSNDNKYNVISDITGGSLESTLNYNDDYSKSRLFLKVQDGCNYSCSYCTIPKARGRSRSVDVDAVVQQIINASEIYSEVVLTGIHLGTYGYDLYPKQNLSYLVRSLLNKTIIKRIRLSSLEINEIDNELIDLLHDRRVCNHLHIPVQSGDDRILRLMKRNYTVDRIRKGIENIIKIHPDISIGTDIITGFPSETDYEFKNTYNIAEKMPFSYFHVFPYSDRPGTEASLMPSGIDPSLRSSRVNALIALGSKKKKAYMEMFIGRTLDSLIEETSSEGLVTGITSNYLKVRACATNLRARSIVSIRIDGCSDDMLTGFLI